jgi:hypothetical protein
MPAFLDEYQRKQGIINDIDIVRVNSFTDQCLPLVGKNLFHAHQLHQDQVSKTFLAHIAPGLSIIMIFVFHDLLYLGSLLLIKTTDFMHRNFLQGIIVIM